MSAERDPGWAYTNPTTPPAGCRCDLPNVVVRGVVVCPVCDSAATWPSVTGETP